MRKKERFVMFLAVLLVCCSTALVSAFTLPDTGQTKCYDTAGAEIACTGTGQDGAYSINPMSYTDNGNGTITDNVTGLMWQKGENATTYNWYQASGTYDATNNPTSQNVCGSLTLGGHSDWRLPAKKELITIVDYGISSGATINMIYFPNAHAYGYWSSNTDAVYTYSALNVSFNITHLYSFNKSYDGVYVRCVRGVQSSPSFTNNGNGTVTDNGTGLMWQQGELGSKTWADALSYCEGLSLGGQSDWRLPNVKELGSITDYAKYNPAIDTTYFPNIYANKYDYYWSSSTVGASNAGYAWVVYFGYGYVLDGYKSYGGYVRCVRGGQSGSLGNLAALTVGRAGSGYGTVTSAPSGINCGTACSASFAAGTSVTLTAMANSVSSFDGWSGECAGTGTCTVTLNADTSVTATFSKTNTATDTLEYYFPMAEGNKWIYKRSSSYYSCDNFSGTEDWNGYSGYKGYWKSFTYEPDINTSCINSGSGYWYNLVLFSNEGLISPKLVSSNGQGIYTPPTIRFPADVSIGATVVQDYTYAFTDNTTNKISYQNNCSATITVIGMEDVSVAAGYFQNCLKVQQKGTCNNVIGSTNPTSSWKIVSWLAAGVGQVKFDDYSTADASSPSYSSQLIKAYVNGTYYNATPPQYTLTTTKTGNGTITSSPSGINCGGTCSASFTTGTGVTLTAVPDSGYTFTGWSGGGCSGSGTCTVTVNSDLAVTATFTVIPAATNNCAASLTTELSLHIPIITYNGNSYWADFLNVPNTLNFTLTNANTVSDTSPYSGCTPASLSSDSKLHVPVIMYNGASYWADFLYTGGVNFSFVNAGGN